VQALEGGERTRLILAHARHELGVLDCLRAVSFGRQIGFGLHGGLESASRHAPPAAP
jgi:hypothetical protein